MSGEWKWYHHQNGELKHLGFYVNGKMSGEWKSYYVNGQLREIGKYSDDKKTGEWKEYGRDGELIKTENFD